MKRNFFIILLSSVSCLIVACGTASGVPGSDASGSEPSAVSSWESGSSEPSEDPPSVAETDKDLDNAVVKRELSGASDVSYRPFATKFTDSYVSGIRLSVMNGWNLNDVTGLERMYDDAGVYNVRLSLNTVESYAESQLYGTKYVVESVQEGTSVNDDGEVISWHLLRSNHEATGGYDTQLVLLKPFNNDKYKSIMIHVTVLKSDFSSDNEYWENADVQELVDSTFVEFTDNYLYDFPEQK